VAQVVKFVAVIIFATTISASIGITSLAFAGDAGFWSLWLTWRLGDAVGALVITPLLLTWVELPRPVWTGKRAAELLSLILVASIEERLQADARAQEAHQQLERRVQQRTEALHEANSALETEIAEREQSAQALRSLLAATGLSTDEEFLHSCTRDLAQIYRAAYAFVGVFADAEHRSIRTLAVGAGDSFVDNFVCDLQGTPCQDALNLDIELVPRDAALRYPGDAVLVQMGVDSYFGAPLISPSNSLMGLVAVMDTGPMSPQSWIKPVLGIFANRMALELERKTAEDELKLAAGVFRDSSEAIMITDRDTRILRVNPAFSRITGYRATAPGRSCSTSACSATSSTRKYPNSASSTLRTMMY
jgi:PAS domain-containing protein